MAAPRFEFFVARRYLKAKRKQAVISLITVISVIGVAAGVMALIVALAITNGFRQTLQRNLLGATAHVSILEKEPGPGIENWREVMAKVVRLPHVTDAMPTLYGYVLFSGPMLGQGGVLKGLDVKNPEAVKEVAAHIKQGSAQALMAEGGLPGVVMGVRLAKASGMMLNSIVTVINPQGELTPLGPRPVPYKFRVVGLFESGFYDLDSTWAFTTLPTMQKVLAVGDVVNSVEVHLDDIQTAPEVAKQAEAVIGPRLAATHWMEQNRQLLNALKMDRVVTIVTIGLIQLVAALNILITLIMMVMEKQRDIAILMSMGARREQIRNIFLLQGTLIGAVGTAIGLVAGYAITFLGDEYRWIQLDEEVYSISYVPFEARWSDGIWVAVVAILISLLATLYPAYKASKVGPVEALRYE